MSVAGQCSPCPDGWSSELGGVCVQCHAGFSSIPGGPCTPCPAGTSSNYGDLCRPCFDGYSSESGGPCYPCKPGTFSISGGLCQDCPAGYSSVSGSSACQPCGLGQTSKIGTICTNNCPDGQIWSMNDQRCEICKKGTFAHAGDLACSLCPYGTYSLDGYSSCFPKSAIGGIMKLDQVFQTSREEDFVRSIAQLASVGVNDVQVIAKQPGSTIYYFYLRDSSVEKSQPENSANAQMIRLYDWYIADDTILQRTGLPPIISFQLVMFDAESYQPIPLLLGDTSSQEAPIVPPQPSLRTDQTFIVQNNAMSRQQNSWTISIGFTLLILTITTLLLW